MSELYAQKGRDYHVQGRTSAKEERERVGGFKKKCVKTTDRQEKIDRGVDWVNSDRQTDKQRERQTRVLACVSAL